MELLPFCNRKVNKMKKIGVLTSGGDAPGMNAAIRAVVKTAIANGIQPIGFIKGYNGILEKNYHVMDRESVSGIIHSGGTILKTARCMEFYEASYREKAFHNAKEIGLDGLVVIGGDGSYRGAGYLPVPGVIDFLKELKKRGVRTGTGTDMTAYIQYKKLESLGAAPYIDFMVSSEEAGVEKPHPHLFEICVEKSGVQAVECAFIGDNYKKDVEGACNSGLRGIWYTQEQEPEHETDYPIIRSFTKVDIDHFLK